MNKKVYAVYFNGECMGYFSKKQAALEYARWFDFYCTDALSVNSIIVRKEFI